MIQIQNAPRNDTCGYCEACLWVMIDRHCEEHHAIAVGCFPRDEATCTMSGWVMIIVKQFASSQPVADDPNSYTPRNDTCGYRYLVLMVSLKRPIGVVVDRHWVRGASRNSGRTCFPRDEATCTAYRITIIVKQFVSSLRVADDANSKCSSQ